MSCAFYYVHANSQPQVKTTEMKAGDREAGDDAKAQAGRQRSTLRRSARAGSSRPLRGEMETVQQQMSPVYCTDGQNGEGKGAALLTPGGVFRQVLNPDMTNRQKNRVIEGVQARRRAGIGDMLQPRPALPQRPFPEAHLFLSVVFIFFAFKRLPPFSKKPLPTRSETNQLMPHPTPRAQELRPTSSSPAMGWHKAG